MLASRYACRIIAAWQRSGHGAFVDSRRRLPLLALKPGIAEQRIRP
jgi:hypothetical protein